MSPVSYTHLVCEVPEGKIFYEETRQREHVSLTPELRSTAQTMAEDVYKRQEPTSVEKAADELWVAEKFQSNSEIAGSPEIALGLASC